MLRAIYILFDAREPTKIRYVGQTKDPKSRRLSHRSPGSRSISPVAHWSRHVMRAGGSVELHVIDWAEDWEAAEKHWIAHYGAQGAKLLNVEAGGLGSWAKNGKKPQATRPAWFKTVMRNASLLVCRLKAAGEAQRAEKLTWALNRIRQQRRHVAAAKGQQALIEFDRDLITDVMPWAIGKA